MERKNHLWIIIVVILGILLLGAIGWGYYSWKKSQDAKNQLQSQIDELKNKITTTTTSSKKKTTTTTTKSSAKCPNILSESDKIAIAKFASYTNNKYNFTFRYMEELTVDQTQDDYMSFKGSDDSLMQVRIDKMAVIDFPPDMKVTGTTTLDLNCAKVTKINYMTSDNTQMTITASFTKDSIPYLFTYTFPYVGASISSDLVEAFDLTLKSLEFN